MAWYRENVLWKIEKAFAAGYDPTLALSANATGKSGRSRAGASGGERTRHIQGASRSTQHVRRGQQDEIDSAIQGKEVGRYFVLLGPKGTGKTKMILDAMRTVDAEGVAMCDMHCDLEVFRVRLGKALNYQYSEDTQAGLFYRRVPREGGAAMDIERALNKLEKVALRNLQKTQKPLVLVLNNVHYLSHNEDGRNMLSQLQQRAEAWAASGILTMVFSSDDFWPFFMMRQQESRMHVISVYDLSTEEARNAAQSMCLNAGKRPQSPEALTELVQIVGGRLTYLEKAARSSDMVGRAKDFLTDEKVWLLGQIGLIPDCDDDMVEEQKRSSSAWVLLREFVRKHKKETERVQAAVARGEMEEKELHKIPLPRLTYDECRQIMARPDFMDELDRKNIITIDTHHNVTPDSWLIFHAAEQVVSGDLFDERLDSVRSRVVEIEIQRRTRELGFKDVDSGGRVQFTIDKGDGPVL
ncbi:uncharacterized protein TRAVEDRAFT_40788 [Trametes versicolor FP-101664 SS1]|uniref:Uncharacterized protein n=1 Tax=Trametes versicolor (strain FP-101664) TaxID=717944 RepID=R7S8M1_TRAVS|nr:uncharacterized protein TRAVEDRAFT_40788 [Trametes versicolor FP-101664 SS1]EIW52035.1 hypothetical protein TRAVEDRAFT_40788 [Trametes versicolor FP-101664 SS1]